jgi:hypothetical protein
VAFTTLGRVRATTTTSPISFIKLIKFLIPGAVIPSSLVTRISGLSIYYLNFYTNAVQSVHLRIEHRELFNTSNVVKNKDAIKHKNYDWLNKFNQQTICILGRKNWVPEEKVLKIKFTFEVNINLSSFQ